MEVRRLFGGVRPVDAPAVAVAGDFMPIRDKELGVWAGDFEGAGACPGGPLVVELAEELEEAGQTGAGAVFELE